VGKTTNDDARHGWGNPGLEKPACRQRINNDISLVRVNLRRDLRGKTIGDDACRWWEKPGEGTN